MRYVRQRIRLPDPGYTLTTARVCGLPEALRKAAAPDAVDAAALEEGSVTPPRCSRRKEGSTVEFGNYTGDEDPAWGLWISSSVA